MTAGWLLLAGDCRLATACRWLAESPGGALRGPREGSGGLRDGVGRTLRYPREPWDDLGRSQAGPRACLAYVFRRFWVNGRSELTFSEDSGPSDALALLMCSEIVQEQVRVDVKFAVFLSFRAWGGEPERRGTRTFIADTVSFISYTVYLLLDTWP